MIETRNVKSEPRFNEPEYQIPTEQVTSDEKPLAKKRNKAIKKKLSSKNSAPKNVAQNLTLNDSVAESMAQMFSTPRSYSKPAPNFEVLDESNAEDQSYLNLGIGKKKKSSATSSAPTALVTVKEQGTSLKSNENKGLPVNLLKCPQVDCTYFSRYHYVLQNHINKNHSGKEVTFSRSNTFPWNPITQEAALTGPEKQPITTNHLSVPAMPLPSLNVKPKVSKKGKKNLSTSADLINATIESIAEKNIGQVMDESVMNYSNPNASINKPLGAAAIYEDDCNNDTIAEMTENVIANDPNDSETATDGECAECSMITDDDELQQHILDKHISEEFIEERNIPNESQDASTTHDANQTELGPSKNESNMTKDEVPMETEQLLSEVSNRLTNPLVGALKGDKNDKTGKKKKLNVTFNNEDSFSDDVNPQSQKLVEPISTDKVNTQEDSPSDNMPLKSKKHNGKQPQKRATAETDSDSDGEKYEPLAHALFDYLKNSPDFVRKVGKRGRNKKGGKMSLPVVQPSKIPDEVITENTSVSDITTLKEASENNTKDVTAMDLSSKLVLSETDRKTVEEVANKVVSLMSASNQANLQEDSLSENISSKHNGKQSQEGSTTDTDSSEVNNEPLVHALVDYFKSSSDYDGKVEKRGRPKKGDKRGRPKKSLPFVQPDDVITDNKPENDVTPPKEVAKDITEAETVIDLSSKMVLPETDDHTMENVSSEVVPTLITEADAKLATSNLVSPPDPAQSNPVVIQAEAAKTDVRFSSRKRGLNHVEVLTSNNNKKSRKNNSPGKNQQMAELNVHLAEAPKKEFGNYFFCRLVYSD